MTSGKPHLNVTTLELAEVWRGSQIADLLRGKPELAALYRWPFGRVALPDAMAARQADPWRAPADALVSAVSQGVGGYGVTPAMEASLLRLADPATVAVVTGQQPGFLGGPLYTLFKALTAIGEAERLRADGISAVPVFWMATEDDDFDEVRTAWLLDRGDELQAAQLTAEWRAQQSVGHCAIPPEPFDEVVAQLWNWLPDTEFTPTVMERVVACWGRGATIGEGFGRWLTEMLGRFGLLVVDPTTVAMRRLATPFLHRVLDDPIAPTRLANVAGEKLEALGYPLPTHRPAGLCAFYLLGDDGVRQRLWADGDGLLTSTGGRLELDELRQMVDEEPERFSTSLLLRPVLQDYLFPTAAFVVGPGEVSYAAQVQPIYASLGVTPPLLLPRYSATLVDPKLGRHLDAYDLAVADVWQDAGALLAEVSRAQTGGDTEATFAEALREIIPVLDRLQAYAGAIDPTLERTADSMSNRVRGEVGKLGEKVLRAIRQRDEVLQRRLGLLQTHLYPAGSLQERKLVPTGLLAKFGDGLIDSLRDAFDEAGPGVHLVARIEA